jgi:hypothetical protein
VKSKPLPVLDVHAGFLCRRIQAQTNPQKERKLGCRLSKNPHWTGFSVLRGRRSSYWIRSLQKLAVLFRKLRLEADFSGRDELVPLLRNVIVRTIDEDDGLELKSRVQGKAPVMKRIPVEAEGKDEDGVMIHMLLHVVAFFGTINALVECPVVERPVRPRAFFISIPFSAL